MQRKGVSNLPLHGGHAPRWLFNRMTELAGAITDVVVDEYGPNEFLNRISDPYWFQKNIALTRWSFVGKVMSLLLNMLYRLVINFLPRSKCLLISWLQLPSTVILEPKKRKSATVSTVFPSSSHEVMGPDAMIFVF